jgi:hypothetical protein
MRHPKAVTNLIMTLLRKLYQTTSYFRSFAFGLFTCLLFVLYCYHGTSSERFQGTMVEYLPVKANKSILRGLAFAVSNGNLTDKDCYEALSNKLNYEESMFFKECARRTRFL